MKTEYDILFKLLKAAATGSQPQDIPEGTDWDKILQLASKHEIRAVLYQVVKELPANIRPDAEMSILWDISSLIVCKESARKHAALLKFREAVAKPRGWNITVLKGESLARFYPLPETRECGDNDILVDAPYEESLSELEKSGIQLSKNLVWHSTFRYENISFELHNPLPSTKHLRKHVVDTMIAISRHPENLVPGNGEGIFYPDAIDEIAFLVSHMARHITNKQGGILRGLLDLYLLSRSVDLQDDRLYALLEKAGLSSFAEVEFSALEYLFGPMGSRFDTNPEKGRKFIDNYIITDYSKPIRSIGRVGILPITFREKTHLLFMEYVRQPIANAVKWLIRWESWHKDEY